MKQKWHQPELEVLSVSETKFFWDDWLPGDGKPPWARGDDSDDSGDDSGGHDELGS